MLTHADLLISCSPCAFCHCLVLSTQLKASLCRATHLAPSLVQREYIFSPYIHFTYCMQQLLLSLTHIRSCPPHLWPDDLCQHKEIASKPRWRNTFLPHIFPNAPVIVILYFLGAPWSRETKAALSLSRCKNRKSGTGQEEKRNQQQRWLDVCCDEKQSEAALFNPDLSQKGRQAKEERGTHTHQKKLSRISIK